MECGSGSRSEPPFNTLVCPLWFPASAKAACGNSFVSPVRESPVASHVFQIFQRGRKLLFPSRFSRTKSALLYWPGPKETGIVNKLRISIVQYLNTAPLVWGFTIGPLQGKYD